MTESCEYYRISTWDTAWIYTVRPYKGGCQTFLRGDTKHDMDKE